MPGHVSDKSRAELKREIARWQHELEKDRRRLTRLNRLEERARKEIQRDRAKRDAAKIQLRKAAKEDHGRLGALQTALHLVGTTEHPAGSNGGPAVERMQDRFHMGRGPWCGAFVGYCAEVGGHADLSDRIVYTPYIYEDAKAGRNGLLRVIWTRAGGWQIRGQRFAPVFSLVLYDFGSGGIKHVGATRKRWEGGTLETVEGNTSFGNGGSQDNGGAVARRERTPSLAHSVVAIDWR
jgi:hypothetical protein